LGEFGGRIPKHQLRQSKTICTCVRAIGVMLQETPQSRNISTNWLKFHLGRAHILIGAKMYALSQADETKRFENSGRKFSQITLSAPPRESAKHIKAQTAYMWDLL